MSTLGNVVNIFDICYQCKSLAQKHEENYITDKTSNLYYGVNPWVATANACQGELVVAIKYQFDITDVKRSHRLVVETELGCDKHLEIKIER